MSDGSFCKSWWFVVWVEGRFHFCWYSESSIGSSLVSKGGCHEKVRKHISKWFYLDRAFGGDSHHWHINWTFAASGAKGAWGSIPHPVHEQHEADGVGLARVPWFSWHTSFRAIALADPGGSATLEPGPFWRLLDLDGLYSSLDGAGKHLQAGKSEPDQRCECLFVEQSSGCTEDENLCIRISDLDQCNSVIRKYLNDSLRNCTDENIIEGMTDGSEIYIKFITLLGI